MFDNLKAMAGLASALKDMPRIKRRFEEVKLRLRDARLEGEAGGGAVRVVCSGLMTIHSVHLGPQILAGAASGASQQFVESLIADATNDALARARALAEQELSRAASELGLPIPPGVLSGYLT